MQDFTIISAKNTSAEGFDLADDLTYNLPYNIIWPAVVVHYGTSSEGLPMGVHVVAKS